MRPKSRISPLIAQLQRVWEADPDLRFGQLIYNVVCRYCRRRRGLGGEKCCDMGSFEDVIKAMEDDRFQHALDDWIKNPPLVIKEAKK